MTSIRNVGAQTRVLWTSSTAGTFYPTGVPLGLKGNADAAAGDVFGAADTVSSTNTDSPFHLNRSKVAVIYRIQILAPGTVNPTFKLQDHTGQKDLTPTIATDNTAAVGLPGSVIDFAFGLRITGGFRYVTAGTTSGIIQIVYEILDP